MRERRHPSRIRELELRCYVLRLGRTQNQWDGTGFILERWFEEALEVACE